MKTAAKYLTVGLAAGVAGLIAGYSLALSWERPGAFCEGLAWQKRVNVALEHPDAPPEEIDRYITKHYGACLETELWKDEE